MHFGLGIIYNMCGIIFKFRIDITLTKNKEYLLDTTYETKNNTFLISYLQNKN